MAQKEQIALTRLLSHVQAFITYQPLRTEVAVLDFITLPRGSVTYQIPQRASADPTAEADKIKELFGTKDATILIPGRAFDAAGTREGQGGGWYDRFLALVPREWHRIGFCFNDQFSSTPLKREAWDQAMDYVVVVNRETKAIALYSSEGSTPT